MTAADFTQLKEKFDKIIGGAIGESQIAEVSVSGGNTDAALLADANAIGTYADHQITRVSTNAKAALSTWDLIGEWALRATEWALKFGGDVAGWIFQKIHEIKSSVEGELEKLRELVVKYHPVLLVPGKGLRDAKRWMTVRTHLNNYRDAIDKDYINVLLKDGGGVGWQGSARDRYWNGLQKQYDAAGTMMIYATYSSSGILMFANGVSRVVSSFASELYAVLVRIGELIFAIFTLSLSNVISGFNAVLRQFGAMAMYFTSNYLAAEVGLDYAYDRLLKVQKETNHLLYGWPDPTREGGYPTVQPDGKVTPLPVL